MNKKVGLAIACFVALVLVGFAGREK